MAGSFGDFALTIDLMELIMNLHSFRFVSQNVTIVTCFIDNLTVNIVHFSNHVTATRLKAEADVKNRDPLLHNKSSQFYVTTKSKFRVR